MWISLFLALLLLPSWAWAAIDCTDASASVQEDATPADPDVYLTYTAPSGSNKITIVGTGQRQGASAKVATPTIGGNAMTAITAATFQDPAGGRLWYRLNVGAGSADVSVDWDAVPLASAHGVITCSGVDQVSPIRTSNTATGTSTTPSVTLTGCLSGDMIIDFVTRDGNAAFTVGADQTQISQPGAPTEMNAAMSRQAGSGDGVMSWSHASEQWTIQAVCLAQAASTDLGGGALWFP